MLISIIFIIGYAAIAFEHPIKINKTASALLVGTICWTVYAMSGTESHSVQEKLSHHLSSIAEILFFLLGAMTIVELIDAHQGFKIITDQISSKKSVTLLWTIGLLAFFLSSVLDNLTTAIVMVSLLRKIVSDTDQRKFFAGIVIIAANAGGAWSPIGDVTTTMLWIGGQISTLPLIQHLFLPEMESRQGNVYSFVLERVQIDVIMMKNEFAKIWYGLSLGMCIGESLKQFGWVLRDTGFYIDIKDGKGQTKTYP
jgi:Na+/H+ antiporter NhaD/arsenite permease-like protein